MNGWPSGGLDRLLVPLSVQQAFNRRRRSIAAVLPAPAPAPVSHAQLVLMALSPGHQVLCDRHFGGINYPVGGVGGIPRALAGGLVA